MIHEVEPRTDERPPARVRTRRPPAAPPCPFRAGDRVDSVAASLGPGVVTSTSFEPSDGYPLGALLTRASWLILGRPPHHWYAEVEHDGGGRATWSASLLRLCRVEVTLDPL